MSYINITNIKFKENKTKCSSPFCLEISFDCLKEIKKKVEFKFVYILESDNKEKDQILDTIEMEEVNYGAMMFEWEVNKPDYTKLDDEFDIFDTTAIMIIVTYEDKEFFRCSYLIRHQYCSKKNLDNEPEKVDWEDLERIVNIEKPVIKVGDIDWN